MFADVLILNLESNYDQVLTYSLQDDNIKAGFLVIVPLKGHLQKGLIIKTYTQRPKISIQVLKSVESVIEPGPLLSTQSLALAKWISSYYLCSLNKALSLFLPPPVRLKKTRKMLVKGEQEISSRLLLADLEKDIVEFITLNKRQNINKEQIIRKFGAEARSALELLIKDGFLQEKEQYAFEEQHKKVILLSLTKEAPSWLEINKRAPKQAAVLKVLENGVLDLVSLKMETGVSGQTIKGLIEKGWLKEEKQVELRDPTRVLLESYRPKTLNGEQEKAAAAIIEGLQHNQTLKWLLYGITGSGKTEVYLQAIAAVIKNGQQALYLVPEIALTPQIMAVLKDAFKDVALLHSSLSDGERFDEWMRIWRGEARVIIGARSALFAPFSQLGLIIIDEEHEQNYKQSEPDPRYDARKVAGELARLHRASLVAGSATPSLAAYSAASLGKINLLQLRHRVADRPLPAIKIVDMKQEIKEGHQGLFSRALLDSLHKVFCAKEQAILFLNRRGFHTYIQCQECGAAVHCPNCSIALTLHRERERLVCHYCSYHSPIPIRCKACGSGHLRYSGTGTERVDYELSAIFPNIGILRLDADTTRRKGSHTDILKTFQEGNYQLLIGTQMVAKGLDFPGVTLVGVVNADALLNMPDFLAGERAFQMFTQVAGRAGRGEQPGEVIIQTFDPNHYVFESVMNHSYEDFFRSEISYRKMMKYPPFHRLVRVLVTGSSEKKVEQMVNYFAELLKIEMDRDEDITEMLGPTPAPLSFLKGRYRYHFVLKGNNLNRLRRLANIVRCQEQEGVRVIIDVEPNNLL